MGLTINDLCAELAQWQDGLGTREDAERAIVQAAAQITGLTADMAMIASTLQSLPTYRALRKFAELAKEDE